MKVHFMAIALVLLLSGLFPSILFAAQGTNGLTVPAGWLHFDKAITPPGFDGYFTGQDRAKSLVVLIRTITGKTASALEWATNEVKVMESSGLTVPNAPGEVAFKGSTWVRLESRSQALSPSGKTVQAKIEQYFVKARDGGIVEVRVNSSEENFTPANQESVAELLASFEPGEPENTVRMAPVTDDVEAKRLANAERQKQLLAQAESQEVPEEKRKLFYQEYLKLTRALTAESQAKYPWDLAEQARFRMELKRQKTGPLLAKYGLKKSDIAAIVSEAAQKGWNDGKE